MFIFHLDFFIALSSPYTFYLLLVSDVSVTNQHSCEYDDVIRYRFHALVQAYPSHLLPRETLPLIFPRLKNVYVTPVWIAQWLHTRASGRRNLVACVHDRSSARALFLSCTHTFIHIYIEPAPPPPVLFCNHCESCARSVETRETA